MANLKAISFDIGDTLVFDVPDRQQRLTEALHTVGLEFDESAVVTAFRRAEDHALDEYVKGVMPEEPTVVREMMTRFMAALGLPAMDDRQLQALEEAFVAIPFRRVLHPEAVPLLSELRSRGFMIGVVSDWEPDLQDELRALKLDPHLDALAVSAIVGVTKPHPLIFQDLLRQLQLTAAEVLHVGDYYELDVIGANAAGMQAVLFDWKQRCPECQSPRFVTFEALADYLLALPAPSLSAAVVPSDDSSCKAL